MDNRNETSLRSYRFLDENYFLKLYEGFLQAFSDYVVPFALTEAQFRNHIILNAVDLDSTMGCLVGDRLVGFSLNGFGHWNGLDTVYDAGTGVIPEFRRQGISEKMFDVMLVEFRKRGIKQWLLEVVTTNKPAIKLYEKLGFKKSRELALLQCSGPLKTAKIADGIEVRQLDAPDWDVFRNFAAGRPSWQNSIEAINRSWRVKRTLAAYADDKCLGYIIFSANFGRVAQLAVDEKYRHQGVGSALLQALRSQTGEGNAPQVINIDKSLLGAMAFFRDCGFTEILSQYEMILSM